MIESIQVDPKIRLRNPKHLINAPVVIRVHDISEEAVTPFAEQVSAAHDTGQPIIPIVIDSLGGDLYAMWAMIDILEGSSLPVATIIEGKAMSAAAALFVCGTDGYRFVGPHSSLMIHDVSSEEVGGKPHEMKVNAEETERLNRNMYEYMEGKIGKRKGYLWKLAQKQARADWYLTPEEAVRHHIANHIKIPTLRTKITVETTLDF